MSARQVDREAFVVVTVPWRTPWDPLVPVYAPNTAILSAVDAARRAYRAHEELLYRLPPEEGGAGEAAP